MIHTGLTFLTQKNSKSKQHCKHNQNTQHPSPTSLPPSNPKKKRGNCSVFFPSPPPKKKTRTPLPPPFLAFRKDVARSSPNSWPSEKPWKASAKRAAARVSKLPWAWSPVIHQSSTGTTIGANWLDFLNQIQLKWMMMYICLREFFWKHRLKMKWLNLNFWEKMIFWVGSKAHQRMSLEKPLFPPDDSRHTSPWIVSFGLIVGVSAAHSSIDPPKKRGFQLPGDSKWPFWDG